MSFIAVARLAFLPLLVLMMLSGCASEPTQYDYSAFRKAQPKSILILPPTNKSPDINASNSILATATYPVAEGGYYVFPAAVVSQMFKENGLTSPHDIHQLPITKLHEVFGADAALYIDIKEYGASYLIVSSNVQVTLEARLLDLRSGDLLWRGSATASNQEGEGSSNQGGLIGMMVSAVIEQIINDLTDPGYEIGEIANRRMLIANPTTGLLHGPRSPHYGIP